MFASCCACVNKKPKVKTPNSESENLSNQDKSPTQSCSKDKNDGEGVTENVDELVVCPVNTVIVEEEEEQEPEEENVPQSSTTTSPTCSTKDDVLSHESVKESEDIQQQQHIDNNDDDDDDDEEEQQEQQQEINNIETDALSGGDLADSANSDEYTNESSEQNEQTISDTTIISRNSLNTSNSPQNVPAAQQQSISSPLPSSPKNDTKNGTSTSSPPSDELPNDQPKSCLSRRGSARASIKKKVNYSEDQEIIPSPDPVFIAGSDDDEVFSDSISPKIPRGDMCTPYPKKKGSIPGMVLPDWFFDEREVSGILEPPATPIGRDELALKRHRFFTDLLTAAQAAVEHRVRFDPLGPNVSLEAKDCDPNLKPSTTVELEGLINRLEKIVERLERAVSTKELERINSTINSVIQKTDSEELDCIPLPSLPVASSTQEEVEEEEDGEEDKNQTEVKEETSENQIRQVDSQLNDEFLTQNGDQDSVDLDTLPTVISQICIEAEEEYLKQLSSDYLPSENMSVTGFEDLVSGPLSQYLQLSKTIGNDVLQHADIVQRAFAAQLEYVKLASAIAQPNQAKQQELLKPTSDCIMAIQNYVETHRSSEYRNHLQAISESIPALGWVCISPTPGPHVKEMICSAEYYTNRILKDYKEKNKVHVEWAKTWIQLLTDLRQYIMQYHTTGLVWSGKGDASSVSAAPPPPPPSCPPPPPLLPPLGDLSLGSSGNDDRSALFAQINQGEDITKNLKRVTPDMQTHKNTALRTGPAPFKAPATSSVLSTVKTPAVKEPVFVRDGKKWLIEYHKSNPNLLVENAEMNNVVYMFRCESSTITVKGKINSIIMDSCKKCSILFDSVVSSVEFVNCQSVQLQVLGFVPTISIDKTDGCQMYLSKDSFGVEIISSKSSEMNVLIPKVNGDYTEKPIPEQFKTTLNGESLSTVCVESLG